MENAGLIEMLFSFGVVIALILWELYKTPRHRPLQGGDEHRGKTPGDPHSETDPSE